LRIPGLHIIAVSTILCCALAVSQQKPAAPPNAQPTQPGSPSRADSEVSTEQVQISSGDIRLASGAMLHVEQLNATSISKPSSDGCRQQTIQIHSGRLSLTDAGLTQLINHQFEKKGDPKRVKVTADKEKLKFEGIKAAGMSTTLEAKPAALGDGRIALVTTSMKVEHLPAKGLMDFFGLELDSMMHPKTRAISVDKDNIIVDLRYVSKRPVLDGQARSVEIHGNRIVISFGSAPAPPTRTVARVKPSKTPARKAE